MEGRPALSGSQAIETTLNYVAPGDEPFVYRASHGAEGQSHSEGAMARCAVAVIDGRAWDGTFSLDETGFVLVRHETSVSNFYDPAQVRDIYEDEVARLVCDLTGARRAHVFDHTVRSDADSIREAKQVRDHVEMVHNDYTERSARRRVRDLMPQDEADRLLSRRFAIVNVWRSIGGPVETTPLAMCDARTILGDELIPVERRARDRIGELQQATHDPAHRWFYFPRMDRGEALVFKTFDSATDGRARLSLHTAFSNPAAPADAAPRESIETRVFAFF